MYKIHGLAFSSNTTKVIYVAEELGVSYEYREISVQSGENKSPEHLARHPLGKMPTLTHDGRHLFESGAICRYLASIERSELYPTADHYERCRIDQWMDFFSIHTGRWFNTLMFERVYREKFGMGATNKETEQEALQFIEQQLAVVDNELRTRPYLHGESKTIADLFAYAYAETTERSEFSLAPYPNVSRWYDGIKTSAAVQRGHEKLFPKT